MTAKHSPNPTPPKLLESIEAALGPNWRKARKLKGLPQDFDLTSVEGICLDLRSLVPLDTSLTAAGLTKSSIEFLHRHRKIEPYKYMFEQFDKALAAGEVAALKRLSDPETTVKAADKLKWLLERALQDDRYAPRSKTTKVVTENKSVSVTMKLDKNAIKSPQLALAPPILELEVIKAVPELEISGKCN
jgi:hypothetical protein